MIEQGLVMLIQSKLGSPPFAPGGFPGQLPENQGVPAYTWSVVTEKPDTGLQFFAGLITRHFQIDCFGATAANALMLATLVNGIHGFQGTLPDPDATVVSGCFRSDRKGPKYSDSARNWWVMLEYKIMYRES